MEEMWRVAGLDHVLVMRGTTTEYDATQGAEVIVGLIGADGLRATRSGERFHPRPSDTSRIASTMLG
jgi:hypothetical protein